MINYTLNQEKVEYLNSIIKDKNKLSLLNRFSEKNTIDDSSDMEIVDSNGNILDIAKPAMDILANPYALVKVTFTGGVGMYEQNISYDQSFRNFVSFTVTPNIITIDDETSPHKIVEIMEDFVGKSKLKSTNISAKFNVAEALVIAAMLDMERKSSLRAFLDEMPFTHNSYNTNMIWRMINSTSSSIQWFVYLINEVIGEHVPLTQQQVQDALNQLVEKGIVTHNAVQYQLCNELAMLSNRMIIIDNILSVMTSKQDDSGEILSTGFSCIQSGVHDLLLLDYNGQEIIFETVSSIRLMDCLERFLNCESYFAQMRV